jgi:hypothetical protein
MEAEATRNYEEKLKQAQRNQIEKFSSIFNRVRWGVLSG